MFILPKWPAGREGHSIVGSGGALGANGQLRSETHARASESGLAPTALLKRLQEPMTWQPGAYVARKPR